MSASPKHAICWAEIPVNDLKSGCEFYSAVLDAKLEITEFGGGEIVFLPMTDPKEISGHIYKGKPAAKGTGATVHLVVPDELEACTERSKAAGATLIGDPVTIPAGRFQYIEDPDGNSIGLFELAS
ncbi:VOC family protein [Falsihalocynthiibacter sp. SS001]|uniref:VOC family protein n=1 Tax=Falsihalocynthiibacter sp. SS001 TaxID=3349698 RepID=UPI0036D43A75